MASVPAGLPTAVRASDHLSLGVIAQAFSPDLAQSSEIHRICAISRFRWVQQALAETGKASERDLPA